LALALCIAPVTATAVCVALVVDGKTSQLPWGIGSLLFVFGIYFGLVFPMRYGLGDTHLIIRFGIFRQRIPLADIREVHPTRNPLSSPALSLDRLHVQTGPGFFNGVMISPADRNDFLDDLAKRSGMTREGDRLIRA
jgi:hypothetical protein